jgi:hypothetical protein
MLKPTVLLREGPRLQGGYSGGSGSGVPPYEFLNLYGVFDCRFCRGPELLRLRLPLKAL